MSEARPPAFELAPGVLLGADRLPIIAGPCVIESEEQTLETAVALADLRDRLGLALVFKASFDKANRSSIDSYRGPGLEEGLSILRRIGDTTGLPLLTDVHEPGHCGPVAEVCDVLQIPAFLCRQTDLVVAAAETGRSVNIKKGQFMAPTDMSLAVGKATSTGNERISVTERGTTFGYNNLVVDMRAFAAMKDLGMRVIYDVTHSLQLPGGGTETGGQRQFAEPLALAAIAAGADGVYLEVHPRPDEARSDSTTQLDLPRAGKLLEDLVRQYQLRAEEGS